jgi:hypothetical protein
VLAERCDFVRRDFACVTNFFETDLDFPRKTKTLVPPVRSLTGTISCAATRETHATADRAKLSVIGALFIPNLFFIFILITARNREPNRRALRFTMRRSGKTFPGQHFALSDQLTALIRRLERTSNNDTTFPRTG